MTPGVYLLDRDFATEKIKHDSAEGGRQRMMVGAFIRTSTYTYSHLNKHTHSHCPFVCVNYRGVRVDNRS